jgi:hypothetical protein
LSPLVILFRRLEAGEDPVLHLLRGTDPHLRLLLEHVQDVHRTLECDRIRSPIRVTVRSRTETPTHPSWVATVVGVFLLWSGARRAATLPTWVWPIGGHADGLGPLQLHRIVTANLFGLLGLRSLYFLLAGVAARLHYLQAAVAVILIYIGGTMLLEAIIEGYHLSTAQSLGVITVILAAGVWANLRRDRLKQQQGLEDAASPVDITTNEEFGL